MNAADFDALLSVRLDRTRLVLGSKAQEYASSADRLHNFKRTAAMLGSTPEQCLVGFVAKHLTSVLDLVDAIPDGRVAPMATWEEKIGDSINYLILLEALVAERRRGLVEP